MMTSILSYKNSVLVNINDDIKMKSQVTEAIFL